MGTILDTIVATKQAEVAVARAARLIEAVAAAARSVAPPRDFFAAVAAGGGADPVRLIAEVKHRSPSAGVIRDPFDPVAIARAYAGAGAAALSVLTDERYFGGRLETIAAVRAVVELPVLRKDFMIDPYQFFEARAAGADAVLLIAEVLDDSRMVEFLELTADLGMTALVESHDATQLQRSTAAIAASRARRALVGINNRDLHRQRTDLATFTRLAPLVSRDLPLVAESGLRTPADVATMHAAGARAILVGETLLASPDIAKAVHRLMETTPR